MNKTLKIIRRILLTFIYFTIVSCINFIPIIMSIAIVGFNDTGVKFDMFERLEFVVVTIFIASIAISPVYALGGLLLFKKLKKWVDLRLYLLLAGLMLLSITLWYWQVSGAY